jgi:23S rRNA (guanosine2251-2'-O)-methyltransferase
MKPRSSGSGRGKNSSGTKRLGAKTGAPRGAKPGAPRSAKQAPRQSLKDRPKRPAAVRDAHSPRAPRPDQHGLGGAQIEGRQAVRELLIARKRRAFEVWISNDIEDNEVINDIIELANDQRVPVRRVARKEIEREARSEAPQGVLAMAAPIPDVDLAYLIGDLASKKPKLLIAVDGVTDPGNLGAILRSCDGAGVDGVILPRHRAVHITPTAAKSAAGAAEYVPMCVVGGLPTALQQMKDAGVWIVGLHDAADKSIFELGSLGDESICLVLGAEGPGLSRLVRERCDVLVNIPMLGALSSLNVSVAAALATYEVVRLRGLK